MDGYAYVLEHLSRDEFRRLRAYTPSARSQFSTWLVVVVHRLGLDHHRHRYGYTRRSIAGQRYSDNPGVVRRRLVDLLAEPLEGVKPPTAADGDSDASVREHEFQTALKSALDELTPRDRLLLKLRFELEMPARKIAGVMGFPTPLHVYRRCDHVCRELRTKLAVRGVEDSRP